MSEAGREPFVHPVRAHPDGPRLVLAAVPRALRMVEIVHEESAESVARMLDRLSYEEMAALVVVLAAMVPDDQSVVQLTAWVEDRQVAPVLRSVG